jgi:hypothetical protein
MLAPFLEGYVVVTVGSERPHERKVWLVGLNGFVVAEEGAE